MDRDVAGYALKSEKGKSKPALPPTQGFLHHALLVPRTQKSHIQEF